jgi:NAD(P)-dependent dehydrogenase (short-subunit alcohol dehydrogenase family)
MALDFAADNIRVNSVAPGVTWSNYYDEMLKPVDDPEGFVAALKARSPLNRVAMPMEIAHSILFLASESASFATGTMVTVDGGASYW